MVVKLQIAKRGKPAGHKVFYELIKTHEHTMSKSQFFAMNWALLFRTERDESQIVHQPYCVLSGRLLYVFRIVSIAFTHKSLQNENVV